MSATEQASPGRNLTRGGGKPSRPALSRLPDPFLSASPRKFRSGATHMAFRIFLPRTIAICFSDSDSRWLRTGCFSSTGFGGRGSGVSRKSSGGTASSSTRSLGPWGSTGSLLPSGRVSHRKFRRLSKRFQTESTRSSRVPATTCHLSSRCSTTSQNRGHRSTAWRSNASSGGT